MDGVREFLNRLKQEGQAQGNFRGLLNVLIGRRITNADGTLVSTGLSWRDLATWLKKVRWPKEAARELSLELGALPPRDRLRYWYVVIAQAHVDSPDAVLAGDRLAEQLRRAGYAIGPSPGNSAGTSKSG